MAPYAAAAAPVGQPRAQEHDHEFFMELAIDEGRKNERYPFGAVIVRAGSVVGRGVNASAENPTFHGEIVAIDDYAQQREQREQRTGRRGWADTTLCTTAEPCPMCMSACAWAGIRRVVWGTSIEGLRRTGLDQIDIPVVAVADAATSFYRPQLLLGGVLADPTDALFRCAQAIREGEAPDSTD